MSVAKIAEEGRSSSGQSLNVLNLIKKLTSGPTLLADRFPFNLFYLTTLISLSITGVIGWIAARADRELILPHSPEPQWLESATKSIFLDPFLIHLLTGFFASAVIYTICKNRNQDRATTISAILTPWLILIVTYFFSDLVFKNSFDFPRPLNYQNSQEPPIVQLFHNLFGVGGGTPSGFVTRQIVLFFIIIWLSSLPEYPISATKYKLLVHLMNVLLIFAVAALRVYRNSHTLFDVAISIGAGTMIFWLIFVLPYAFYKRSTAITNVGTVYLSFVAVLFFYVNNPRVWIISSFSIVGGLILLRGVVEFMITRRKPTGG